MRFSSFKPATTKGPCKVLLPSQPQTAPAKQQIINQEFLFPFSTAGLWKHPSTTSHQRAHREAIIPQDASILNYLN